MFGLEFHWWSKVENKNDQLLYLIVKKKSVGLLLFKMFIAHMHIFYNYRYNRP